VRLARGERLEGFQMNWRTPAGDRSVIVFGDTLPAMHGHPAMAVCMFQDITHLKHAEQAVRRAQKLESLGVLAGGVAHDFNNLLTGIMGNASLLADTCADPEHQEMAREVLVSSERAAELTRQLLAYSGKGRFVMEPVNLSTLAAEIVALLPRSLPKGVRLETKLDGELPEVWADAAQMRQLITNLLLNGAEAIGVESFGTVALRTGVEVVDAGARLIATSGEVGPGRYVSLEVCDDGCGMDAETQARIFDPFFTTKFAGRGLGLAAVLGIVRGHEGAIRVESRPGHGTRVQVVLPCALASLAHDGGDAVWGAGDGG
jgi:signal transduction histidine kinase